MALTIHNWGHGWHRKQELYTTKNAPGEYVPKWRFRIYFRDGDVWFTSAPFGIHASEVPQDLRHLLMRKDDLRDENELVYKSPYCWKIRTQVDTLKAQQEYSRTYHIAEKQVEEFNKKHKVGDTVMLNGKILTIKNPARLHFDNKFMYHWPICDFEERENWVHIRDLL